MTCLWNGFGNGEKNESADQPKKMPLKSKLWARERSKKANGWSAVNCFGRGLRDPMLFICMPILVAAAASVPCSLIYA